MEFKLDAFFNGLYERYAVGGQELADCLPDSFAAVRDAKRSLLEKLLGLDRIREWAVEPAVEEVSLDMFGDYNIDRLTMTILPGFTMPVHVVRPLRPNGKYVLYSHGHGEGGVRDCFKEKHPPAYHKNIPLRLAHRGYTVYCYEPAGFGDFTVEKYKSPEDGACYPITMRLHLYGATTLGLRLFQAMSLADYMIKSEKTENFAAAGISGGGTVTALLGALDDRPKACVISCYSNLFKTSIMAMHHCSDNFVPRLLEVGELPHIISLRAPGYLFLSSGLDDPIYPLEGARASYEIIKGIYRKLGAEDRLEQEFFEGTHEFSEAFIDWLDKVM